MRIRGAAIVAGALASCALLGLTGCQSTDATCSAGLSAQFDLTVRSAAAVEPSVQYCALGHCTPRPAAGAIPHLQQNTADDHAATVTHIGRGEWRIHPRSTGATPNTVTVRLYRNGTLIRTRIVRLRWPARDPCAASNPPDPHPTIQS